jgi:acetyl-CoA carboxylase biotin carboxyl carrier protein
MAKFTVDSELVRTLADLLTETGLTEVEITDGDKTVRVARHGHPVAASRSSTDTHVDTTGTVETGAMPAPTVDADHPGTLVSPMVGTAFLSLQPGADPFVRAGDRVNEGQTLLIIEAMKVMNPIAAVRSGVVRSILVEDGQPVEFGESLMVIE